VKPGRNATSPFFFSFSPLLRRDLNIQIESFGLAQPAPTTLKSKYSELPTTYYTISMNAMYVSHTNQQHHENRNHHSIPPPLPMTRVSSSSSSSQSGPPPQPNNGMIQNLQQPQQPPSQSCRGDGNRIYSLEVKQQPIRARMCGFGDKVR
jgi:hypothetical protein